MPSYNSHTSAEEVAENCASDIANKTVLVTGVTPGSLGAGFAMIVAKYSPHLIILANRNVAKAEETAKMIAFVAPGTKTRILELDLGSQAQIRKAAEEVISYEENIDILVNSAGVMAPPYTLTKDGLESQFGINHIGHFLFANLIISKLLTSGKGARILSVASDGFRLGPIRFDDWNFDDGKTYDMWRGYGQAKTANMLFAVSLAEKLGKSGLTAVSLHPGVIATNLVSSLDADKVFNELAKMDREQGNRSHWSGFEWKSLSQGVATYMFGAFDPSVSEHNGSYLSDCQVIPPDQVRCWGRDRLEAEKLWKLSEEIVGQKFEY